MDHRDKTICNDVTILNQFNFNTNSNHSFFKEEMKGPGGNGD